MEKDNVKENQTKSEVEEKEVETSNIETTETEAIHMEENTNVEIQKLINDEEHDKDKIKKSCAKGILANILDQVLVVAVSSLLVLLCDVVLRLFGYMFAQGTGAIIIAAGIIYFILNCIYAPIMEKSKARNTIARKILNF